MADGGVGEVDVLSEGTLARKPVALEVVALEAVKASLGAWTFPWSTGKLAGMEQRLDGIADVRRGLVAPSQ